MNTQEYITLVDGHCAGTWSPKGTIVDLTPAQAQYENVVLNMPEAIKAHAEAVAKAAAAEAARLAEEVQAQSADPQETRTQVQARKPGSAKDVLEKAEAEVAKAAAKDAEADKEPPKNSSATPPKK